MLSTNYAVKEKLFSYVIVPCNSEKVEPEPKGRSRAGFETGFAVLCHGFSVVNNLEKEPGVP